MFEFGTNGMTKETVINGQTYVYFPIDGRDRYKVREAVMSMKPDSAYTVTVKKFSRKRSNNSNSYAWVLIGELAKVLKTTRVEVYREYVKEIAGAYEIVPIPEKGVDTWMRNWESNGLGWVCEDLGESEIQGCRNIICHYGSSRYNQEQMNQLIDLIVFDCKEQGIETRDELELKAMIASWGEKGKE